MDTWMVVRASSAKSCQLAKILQESLWMNGYVHGSLVTNLPISIHDCTVLVV